MIDRFTSKKLRSEFQMTVAQWRIIEFVCSAGPATASYIGSSAEIDQAEISRAVRDLLEQGLISRESAASNWKAMIISPTRKGESLFERVSNRRREYFSAMTRDLDRRQMAEFERTLEIIGKAVVELRDGDTESGTAKP